MCRKLWLRFLKGVSGTGFWKIVVKNWFFVFGGCQNLGQNCDISEWSWSWGIRSDPILSYIAHQTKEETRVTCFFALFTVGPTIFSVGPWTPLVFAILRFWFLAPDVEATIEQRACLTYDPIQCYRKGMRAKKVPKAFQNNLLGLHFGG